jgi:hypothetical protein
MSDSGGVFKRCGCRDPRSGRLLGSACPKLTERGHGSWYFDCATVHVQGRPERVRRGGYASRRDAVEARDALLNAGGESGQLWTVARWLRYWLSLRFNRQARRSSDRRACLGVS